MPNAAQLQAMSAHQRRIEEIDRAIKDTDKFLDHKAELQDENGKKTLFTRTELHELRAKEEEKIRQLA